MLGEFDSEIKTSSPRLFKPIPIDGIKALSGLGFTIYCAKQRPFEP